MGHKENWNLISLNIHNTTTTTTTTNNSNNKIMKTIGFGRLESKDRAPPPSFPQGSRKGRKD